MRCIVHIRKSLDYAGDHFVLRLFPLYYSSEKQRSMETFSSEASLSERLTQIGLPKVNLQTSLINLRSGADAMWTNIEIVQETFDSLGKPAAFPVRNWALVAA